MNFNNKKVLVIANAGYLKKHRLGSIIDDFDVVIRINVAQTYRHSPSVGSKFDIWTSYNPDALIDLTNTYKKIGLSDNKIKELLKDVKEIWYTTWNQNDLYYNWMYDNLIKKYLSSDINIRVENRSNSLKCMLKLGYKQTTGFNLIWVLSNMLDHFYIVGFSFYGHLIDDSNNTYYYKDVIGRNDLDSLHEWHNPKAEAIYVEQLIYDGKVTILDENTEVTPSKMITIPEQYVCSNCKHPYDVYHWQRNICSKCRMEYD
jgi:hypothetical protein